MPSSERLGLRSWLEEKLKHEEFPVLKWYDREKGYFSISWKHASRHGWNEDQDAILFKAWAVYTGRYKEGDFPEPKTWKANFRCAVNASADIKLVKDHGLGKGRNAFRVYAFSKKRRSKVFVAARKPGIKLHCDKPKLNIKKEPMDISYEREYRPRPTKSRSVCKSTLNSLNPVSTNNKVSEEKHSSIQKKKTEPDTTEDQKIKEMIKSTKSEYKEARLFSFREIIDKIPQIDRGNSSLCIFSERSTSGILSIGRDQPKYFDEKLDDIVFNTMLSDIDINTYFTADEVPQQLEEINKLLYYAESSTSSESDLDMKEIFDDSESYRSHSSSTSDEWNERFMKHADLDRVVSPSACKPNIIKSLSANNDPFFGVCTQPNDVIDAITQVLRGSA